jgi:antitoxin component of MazEF toxin-antitoxin module
MSVKTKLTTSGNSRAVRLPKTLLQASELTDQVELEAKKGMIIIRSSKNPRAGWEEAIANELQKGPIDEVDEFGDMAEEREATVADGLDSLEK